MMRKPLSFILLFTFTIPLQAQVPTPTPPSRAPIFGVEIEVINLTVSVTDSRSRYVTDLKNEDFAVFEDGIRQDLSIFRHEDIPISMVLVLDTSASMDEKLSQAQTAAVRFVRTLRPQDNAQVMQFNDRTTVLQEFTPDHAKLEDAVKRTEASGPTALHNALYVALKDLNKLKKAGELRRRAIVLLSDGEDTASLVNDEQVLELARKTEIAIYAISLRPDTPLSREREGQGRARYFLTALARDTGGQVYFPDRLSDLDSVYTRIASDLRSQYTLGYVSSNAARDGRWRRILVRTPQRDELRSRHKLGYYGAR
jgi:VWFA-related protein